MALALRGGAARPQQQATASPARPAPPRPNDLAARITSALAAARQQRKPLTLALLEIDRFGDVLLQLGPAGMTEAMHSLQAAVGEWSGQDTAPLLVGENQLALVCVDCSRSDGVQIARYILKTVKPWSREQFPLGFDLTLSAGLATLEIASRNYPPADLIDAAHRCLAAAQLSGGDTAKSIAF
jgi:GGDEF domain-containing protein